jgi:hypothetical protein
MPLCAVLGTSTVPYMSLCGLLTGGSPSDGGSWRDLWRLIRNAASTARAITRQIAKAMTAIAHAGSPVSRSAEPAASTVSMISFLSGFELAELPSVLALDGAVAEFRTGVVVVDHDLESLGGGVDDVELVVSGDGSDGFVGENVDGGVVADVRLASVGGGVSGGDAVFVDCGVGDVLEGVVDCVVALVVEAGLVGGAVVVVVTRLHDRSSMHSPALQ